MTNKTKKTIIDILFEDGVPDTYDMMRISLLLYPEVHEDFVVVVVDEIGQEKLEERLEQRLLSWTPYALEMLRTQWWAAIDTWTSLLLDAKERFPDSIGLLFKENELASLWRNANIRAGRKAVEYLESDETHMRQPHQLTLRSSLFSGVAPKQIGSPSRKMRRDVLRRELPKYLRNGHDNLRYTEVLQFHLDHHRGLNRRLIPHLRHTAKAA